MEILFWTVMAPLAWCYVGYPIALLLQARFWPKPLRPRPLDEFPTVSIVVAMRNECAFVERRLLDLLAQSYAPERLEVVVVCNGSTDDTAAIARGLAERHKRIRVLNSPADRGKAGALNLAVASSDADIVVFADARQTFERDAVARLIEPFSDPAVGAVTGRLIVRRAELTSVEGVRLYWGLETRLREAESKTGSVVGATGAIYAARRALVDEVPPNLILDDVYVPLRIAMRGHRILMAPTAVAFDEPARNQRAEFARKRRTMVGNIQLLRTMPSLLLPIRNPLFARFVSHKLLRLLTPLCCFGLLIASASLHAPIYRTFFAAELLGFLAGAVGLRYRIPALSFPAAFVLMHAAILAAFWRWRSDASSVWAQHGRSTALPPVA